MGGKLCNIEFNGYFYCLNDIYIVNMFKFINWIYFFSRLINFNVKKLWLKFVYFDRILYWNYFDFIEYVVNLESRIV